VLDVATARESVGVPSADRLASGGAAAAGRGARPRRASALAANRHARGRSRRRRQLPLTEGGADFLVARRLQADHRAQLRPQRREVRLIAGRLPVLALAKLAVNGAAENHLRRGERRGVRVALDRAAVSVRAVRAVRAVCVTLTLGAAAALCAAAGLVVHLVAPLLAARRAAIRLGSVGTHRVRVLLLADTSPAAAAEFSVAAGPSRAPIRALVLSSAGGHERQQQQEEGRSEVQRLREDLYAQGVLGAQGSITAAEVERIAELVCSRQNRRQLASGSLAGQEEDAFVAIRDLQEKEREAAVQADCLKQMTETAAIVAEAATMRLDALEERQSSLRDEIRGAGAEANVRRLVQVAMEDETSKLAVDRQQVAAVEQQLQTLASHMEALESRPGSLSSTVRLREDDLLRRVEALEQGDVAERTMAADNDRWLAMLSPTESTSRGMVQS